MKITVITFLVILLCIGKLNAQSVNEEDSIVLVKVWGDFRTAFAAKDLPKLKTLSANQVYCSECYDNTPQEKERNEKLMQADEWDAFMKQMYYVPLSKFLSEDVAVISNYIGSKIGAQPFQIYNDSANKTLFTQKLNKKQLSKPIQCYSIIITLTEPSAEFEGLQAVFTFVKTKKGFKFCGYGTVP